MKTCDAKQNFNKPREWFQNNINTKYRKKSVETMKSGRLNVRLIIFQKKREKNIIAPKSR